MIRNCASRAPLSSNGKIKRRPFLNSLKASSEAAILCALSIFSEGIASKPLTSGSLFRSYYRSSASISPSCFTGREYTNFKQPDKMKSSTVRIFWMTTNKLRSDVESYRVMDAQNVMLRSKHTLDIGPETDNQVLDADDVILLTKHLVTPFLIHEFLTCLHSQPLQATSMTHFIRFYQSGTIDGKANGCRATHSNRSTDHQAFTTPLIEEESRTDDETVKCESSVDFNARFWEEVQTVNPPMLRTAMHPTVGWQSVVTPEENMNVVLDSFLDVGIVKSGHILFLCVIRRRKRLTMSLILDG